MEGCDLIITKTRSSVGWASVAHFSFCFAKKIWKIPIPWNWTILPVLKESVAFPKPLIEKFLHTFIFLSYKIMCIVSDMYSAPYKRIASSTFILYCLLFWKTKSCCLYFEPDWHHFLSKKCNFHCNQKDKPDRFVRLRYCSVPSTNKIKQTVPQMVPFVEFSSLPWRDTSICATKVRCVSEKQ